MSAYLQEFVRETTMNGIIIEWHTWKSVRSSPRENTTHETK